MFTLVGFVFLSSLKISFHAHLDLSQTFVCIMAKLDQTFATDCLEMLLCELFSGF